MLEVILSLVSIVLLSFLIFSIAKLKHSIPDIQEVLEDVGVSIAEQLNTVFEKPTVKRVMGVLGKEGGEKSGDVRASTALKNRVAEKALGQNVLLKKALEYLDITPIEGLELLNDPTIGPTIRGLMANFQDGAGGLLSGFGGNNPGSQRSQRNDGRGVPLMS